jgi:nicotine blue oxidoreductase
MGRPKALLPAGPGPVEEAPTFVAVLVRAFAVAGCAPLVVVSGAHRLGCAVPAPAFEVDAPDWAAGMRASLRAGLMALPVETGVLLTHVDRPRVRPTTLAALLEGPAEETRLPVHRGMPGHPVFLGVGLCSRLLDADDTPLDRVIAEWGSGRGRVRSVPVDDPDVLLNVNTPEALAALHRR